MQRRTLLTTGSTALLLGLAGCNSNDNENGNGNGNGEGNTTDTDTATSNEDTDGDGDEIGTPADNQPSIQASDATASGQDGTLEIAFDARAYTRLDDGDQYSRPAEGEVFLLGQYQIVNVGDQPVSLAGGQITVTADGEEAGWTVLRDGSRFDVTLDTGDELDEWLVHTMPEDASEVEVSYSSLDEVAATVERNESVEFTFPET